MSCWENDFNCGCLASWIHPLVCNLFRGRFHQISLHSVLQFLFPSLSQTCTHSHFAHHKVCKSQKSLTGFQMPINRATKIDVPVGMALMRALHKQQMQNYGILMSSVAHKYSRVIACVDIVVYVPRQTDMFKWCCMMLYGPNWTNFRLS